MLLMFNSGEILDAILVEKTNNVKNEVISEKSFSQTNPG